MRHRLGRTPGLTTITSDDQLIPVIREMHRDGVRMSWNNIATRAGFSVDEVRGYLRVTRRTKEEFVRDAISPK